MHEQVATETPLTDLPTSQRIDLVLATLSAMDKQKPGGWSVSELADLCECSENSIRKRLSEAARKLRNKIQRYHPNITEDL